MERLKQASISRVVIERPAGRARVTIYAGRPGLWHDWQKHQAEARKERRVQEELAKRRRAEIAEAIGLGAGGLLIATMVAGLIAWVVWLKGGFK